jgi:hypothetical protein
VSSTYDASTFVESTFDESKFDESCTRLRKAADGVWFWLYVGGRCGGRMCGWAVCGWAFRGLRSALTGEWELQPRPMCASRCLWLHEFAVDLLVVRVDSLVRGGMLARVDGTNGMDVWAWMA